MDNLTFKKAWGDASMIELEISAQADLASARQYCYVTEDKLREISENIIAFVSNVMKDITHAIATCCYVQIGNKLGNTPPAFFMCLTTDECGHITVEVDFEIDDNPTRAHRSSFYVQSEGGCVECFANELKKLYHAPSGTSVSLLKSD